MDEQTERWRRANAPIRPDPGMVLFCVIFLVGLVLLSIYMAGG
jgi:hypothetical protein